MAHSLMFMRFDACSTHSEAFSVARNTFTLEFLCVGSILILKSLSMTTAGRKSFYITDHVFEKIAKIIFVL